MGVEAGLARGAIRVSLGLENTEEDIDRLVASWSRVVRRAREKSKATAHAPVREFVES
jgi:cysteine sulfinate desulfinase/cysteine desulfurase-like protein